MRSLILLMFLAPLLPPSSPAPHVPPDPTLDWEPQQQSIPPVHSAGGYYRPVAPQRQQDAPCGHYGTPACPVEVSIPPGATGEQLYDMASQQRDPGAQLAYLEQSAQLGYVRAEAALGIDYVNGKGVQRDYSKALYWLDLASRQGSRGAEYNLADLLGTTEGVPVDVPRAVSLLKASAAQRYGPAEMALGLHYEFGRGVPHSRATAIQLLRRAQADGAAYAGNYAAALERAPATPFRTEESLAAYAHPAPQQQRGGGCPTFYVNGAGTRAQAGQYLFCQSHPGCPYYMSGMQYSCPR